MANNKRIIRDDLWREKIQTSMLINRLSNNAFGKIELTASQLKSIEILLKKTVPDLKAIEHMGEGGGAIKIQNISQNDQEIIQQYVESLNKTKTPTNGAIK
jgi:hypothetical protein